MSVWSFNIAVMWAILFPISLAYEYAVRRGLRNARDEQHRMTPLSPWRFFTRGFRMPATWIAIVALPYYFCASVIEGLLSYLNSSQFPDWQFLFSAEHIHWIMVTDLPSPGGHTLVSCALITLVAPRFGNLGIAAFLGATLVTISLDRLGVTLWSYLMPKDAWNMLGVGVAAFVVSWFYVRFKLNRAWFRFEA